MTKRIDIEHTQRVGFIIGPNIKVSSTERYEKEIMKSVEGLESGMIEIKKKNTFERDTKSKVFIVYALDNEAQYIDKQIHDTTFEGFQYLLYKLDNLSSRMGAMYANEMINVKARFEILYGAKVDDIVLKDGREIRLDRLLKEQKVNKMPLFIAVE